MTHKRKQCFKLVHGGSGRIRMRITRWNPSAYTNTVSAWKKVWLCCTHSSRESSSCCLTWSKWAELFSGFPSVNCLSGRRKNSAAVGKPGRTVTRSWSSLTPVAWRGTRGKGVRVQSLDIKPQWFFSTGWNEYGTVKYWRLPLNSSLDRIQTVIYLSKVPVWLRLLRQHLTFEPLQQMKKGGL